MRLLFAISVASFFTVLWLALSLAARIRRDRLGRRKPAPAPPAMEFFEAGEFRTPRSLRLLQRLNQQITRPDERPDERHHLDAGYAVQTEPLPVIEPALQVRDSRPIKRAATANAEPLHEAVIIDSKLHFIMAQPPRPAETLPHDTSLLNLPAGRKSPRSARSGTFRRVDLSHYTQDAGDLTDPYTHSPQASGVRPSVAKEA